MIRAPHSTAEKMIPKARLLDALKEILDAARDPVQFAADHNAGTNDPRVAQAFALGWIESVARHAIGAPAPTTGWLA